MNKNDYQNKMDEHRKPIQINGAEKPNTRSSRRSNNVPPKKTKQKRNLLLPILFFFFILIPVSFLIYVFVFYQPDENETTVLENSQVQYEQNEEDIATEKNSDNSESDSTVEENTEAEPEPEIETPKESTGPIEQPVEEIPEEDVTIEETPVVKQPSKEKSKVQQPTTAKTHVVQTDETLYSIAMQYYDSSDAVERIKSANGLTLNSISIGQKLSLP